MTSHRTIFSTLVLVAALVAAPVSASANSLLSGYGGPGQGNQAILGSALLNGPRGGDGSGGGPVGGSVESSAAVGTAPAGSRASSDAQAPSRAGHSDSPHVAGTTGQTSAGFSGTYRASEQGEARSVSDGRTLGLSDEDLLYILLALAALAITSALTRRMANNVPVSTHE